MDTSIQLTKIRLDGGTQLRAAINTETVQEYADAIKAGAAFPPVTLFFDGTDYWLADGFHRYHAAKEAGCEMIRYTQHDGTKRDAILFACQVNSRHGLRRTNEDKRKAVAMLLADEEWSNHTDRKIAELCAVSNQFVTNLRTEVSTVDNSNEKRLGRDGKWYPAYRRAAEASDEAPEQVPEPAPEASAEVPEQVGELPPEASEGKDAACENATLAIITGPQVPERAPEPGADLAFPITDTLSAIDAATGEARRLLQARKATLRKGPSNVDEQLRRLREITKHVQAIRRFEELQLARASAA